MSELCHGIVPSKVVRVRHPRLLLLLLLLLARGVAFARRSTLILRRKMPENWKKAAVLSRSETRADQIALA